VAEAGNTGGGRTVCWWVFNVGQEATAWEVRGEVLRVQGLELQMT
jgi:hypothetical protein